MSQIRPKNLPRVPAPVAGDSIALDGATMRSILVTDFVAQSGPVVNAKRWLKGDGTDDHANITTAIAYCAANNLTLGIPDGTYRHSATIYWAFNNLHVQGLGDNVVFIHTGIGIAHSFSGMALYPGSQGCVGGVFGGPGTITLKGNPAGGTTRVINLDNWHFGRMKVSLRDGTTCFYGVDTGIVGASAVSSKFDIRISNNQDGAFAVQPGRAIDCTSPVVCQFSLTVEGCGAGGQVAAVFNNAIENTFDGAGGAIESNAAGGLLLDITSQKNVFTNFDCEVNGTGLDWDIRGLNNTFIGCSGSGTASGSSVTGNSNVFLNLAIQSLNIHAGATGNYLLNPKLIASFTDSGTNTTIIGAVGGLGITDKVPFTGTVTNTLSLNADTVISVVNTGAGASARAVFSAVNGATAGFFGMGGTGFTDRPILTNRAFIDAGGSTDGIVLNTAGADPIVFGVANVEYGRFTAAGTFNLIGSSTAMLAVGRQGATNPALQINTANANSVTGLILNARAVGADVDLSALSSAANENLTINALGSGSITFGSVSTGPIILGRNTQASGTFNVLGGYFNNGVALIDTDGALTANSATRVPSQAAVVSYVAARIAALDVMLYKGVIDASGNPNYPAADAGNTYRISVAGKIGGALGINVEIGDLIICLADSTASGTQAGVGASWDIIQTNIDGAVVGPASAASANIATFSGVSGKVIQDSGKALPAGTILGTSDAQTVSTKTIDNTNTVTLKDTLFTLQDDGDTTKQARFQLSGITTGTIRTYTLPDVNATLLYSGGPGSFTTVAASSSILSSSPSAGVGYSTGAGGTIGQLTSKSTAVTLNTLCGEITMNNAALAANTPVSFTMNNTSLAAGDVVVVSHQTGGNRGDYAVMAGGTIATATTFQIRNLTAGSLSDAVVLRFAVIKAATS